MKAGKEEYNPFTAVKKKVLLLAVVCVGITTSVGAQISIREDKVVEKPVLRPTTFDSLTNITYQVRPVDYKKYVGYKLFFLPKAKNYKPSSYQGQPRIYSELFAIDSTEITQASGSLYGPSTVKRKIPKVYKPCGDMTCNDSVEGKYFTILGIKGKKYDKEYQRLENLDLRDEKGLELSLKIELRNESNKDTLYWIVKTARYVTYSPFILVPYFEKQKKMYQGQNLIVKDYETPTYVNGSIKQVLENMVDVNTGEVVKVKQQEVWNCDDVSFIDSKESPDLSGFYFLKNGDKEIKIPLGKIEEYFMLEAEYQKRELAKQKKVAEVEREKQEQDKKVQEKTNQFRKDCISKWGQKMGTYIADGKVVLGMSREMCVAAWGNSIDVNRTIVKGVVHEQWVYGLGTYLYFDNGVLTAIQD